MRFSSTSALESAEGFAKLTPSLWRERTLIEICIMRISVFGATGKTGRGLLDQGLELGHEVCRTSSRR